jgi:hypothetical protein
MAKSEVIKIQDGNQVIELTGADKEAFLAQREIDNLSAQANEEIKKTQKALKVSAYTKLGLTEEEINAIL